MVIDIISIAQENEYEQSIIKNGYTVPYVNSTEISQRGGSKMSEVSKEEAKLNCFGGIDYNYYWGEYISCHEPYEGFIEYVNKKFNVVKTKCKHFEKESCTITTVCPNNCDIFAPKEVLDK